MNLSTIIASAENLCANLECDGTTRVINYLLMENNIEHIVKCGCVDMGDENIPMHWWIELPDGRIIDLKAKMWLDNKNAPHGIFKKEDTDAVYTGEIFPMKTSKITFQILTS